MIFTKAVISVLCVLLVVSIFVANLLNIVATDHNFYSENLIEGSETVKRLSEKYGEITDTTKHLVWFLQMHKNYVQNNYENWIAECKSKTAEDGEENACHYWKISDIHISIFRDPGRISQFQQFCDYTVKKIKPHVVLATGDLTDAKAKDNLGSSQVKTEWVYYYNIIQESDVTNHTIWLDIRGNHDNFNIKTINSKENYFRNYSVQGSKHAKSYSHILNHNGVNVAFLGIDACPDPGIRRPFNFIGILDHQEQQIIQTLKTDAEAMADHLVWFGHYPTSCILALEKDSKRLDLRQLIGSTYGSQVYLCGHLHSMGGLVPHMYTKQKKGFLELELGDWKDNRMFRLMAIDHGMFTFADQQHNTWPLVLVTNPKHAKYVLPGREPLGLIQTSKFIRILAFSDVSIESVKISFDRSSWMECRHKEGPLYVCQWMPQLYSNGLHYLYVSVTDEVGREALMDHPFSMDGAIMSFDLTSRILLMLEAGIVFQVMFGTLMVLNVVPLITLRLQQRPPKFRRTYRHYVLRRVWLLTKVNKVYYPLILYAFYLPFGPWAVGELVDGYIGTIFAWGILIKGVFLPEPFTYMYGSVQLMCVQIPLVCVLAHCLETRLFKQNLRGSKRLFYNLPFIFLLAVQILLAYFFWLEYGTMSFLFGPLRTWSVALSIFLWYKTLTLPPDYCRKLINISDVPS